MTIGTRTSYAKFLSAAVFVCAICLITLSTCAEAQRVQSDTQPAVSAESGQHYEQGLRLFNEGNYSEAFTYFQRAYELDNKNIAACFAMGLSRSREKNYAAAADHFRQALEANPGHAKALRLYPAMLFNAGEFDRAADAYDKALAQETDSIPLNAGQAKTLVKLGRHEDALPYFRNALAGGQPDLGLKYLYAQTLAEAGKPKEAADTALEIITADPDHARARIIAADYLRLSGSLNEALEQYKAAAKDSATRTYAQYYIGEIEFELEEREIERAWEESQTQDVD